MRISTRLVLCSLAFAVLPTGRAFAQAWVGNKGEGSVSLDYTFSTSDTLAQPGAPDVTGTKLTTQSAVARIEYDPIDQLGLSLSLPFVGSKYTGTELAHGTYDDGNFHGTLTDLAFRARYQLPIDALALTPEVGFSIPVANYETFGFATPNRHLKALLVGVNAGKLFFNKLFLHGTYEFGIPESYSGDCPKNWADPAKPTLTPCDELGNYSQLRSDLAIQVGYFFIEQLEVHLAMDGHWQHGGVDFSDPNLMTDPVIAFGHDPVLQDNFIDGGAGLTWYASDAFSFQTEFRTFLSGKNTPKAFSLTLGAGWNFGG